MEKRDQDQCVGCCETDIPTFSLVNYEWFQYKIKYDGKENKCRKTWNNCNLSWLDLFPRCSV